MRLLRRFKNFGILYRTRGYRRDWSKFWLCIISLTEEHIVATDEGRVRFADGV